ncbi:MAG: hypothetical protein D6E12_03460 [Desulfovibrio sp.]|nr:MAG: hypothetical protein D6E12_03460 [Desulfovibrio sp.]
MQLAPCPKGYTSDQDKAVTPEETVARAKAAFSGSGRSILAESRRIDTGRLGIPVFVSMAGPDAREIMPTRKQMGKGASPAQAEASGLMELVERYSFFAFWNDPANFTSATWSQAEERFSNLLPLPRMLQSVGEDLGEDKARQVLDLLAWRFCPALDVAMGQEVTVPLDWFKTLNEFNGSCAGNTTTEAVFQGACELVERHVCAVIDREHTETPTIDPDSLQDPVLKGLLAKFRDNGIRVLLKDFTLSMPVPTVAAICMDPVTFPGLSEIVFTAGTAASPAKAAIRALAEVAQLAGDFETGAVYEASGLSKFADWSEAAWLEKGPMVPLDSLPNIEREDMLDELKLLAQGLDSQGYQLLAVETSQPELGLSAAYTFVPGFGFRERDLHASLGLFTGRKLAEDVDPVLAQAGLGVLEDIYPSAHFTPFFQGLLALRMGDPLAALEHFARAEPLQPDADSKGLAAFYQAHALQYLEDWEAMLPHLDRAVTACPEVKEYFNLRGVAKFKLQRYTIAAEDFARALDLDRGSAMDLANLGICHKFMGRHESAKDYLSSALELDPSLEFARNHLEELTGAQNFDGK